MAWTLADVKDWLGITVNTWDTELTNLMARALYTVEHELDWHFGTSRPAEEILDGSGTRAMYLRQPPLGDVNVWSRPNIDQAWEAVDSDDYEVGGRGVFLNTNWTEGVRNYRFNYDEGFVTMPGDVEQLILDLVAMRWRNRDNDPTMKSETIGDYSYTRGDLESSTFWESVVMRYRRGRI